MKDPNQTILASKFKAPLPEVFALDLSHCNLTVIEGIETCDRLEVLRAQHNKLRSIDEIFHNLKNIRKLDLSYNEIESVEGFQSFPAFGSLILDHNKLTFKELAKLRGIHIVHLGVQGNQKLIPDGDIKKYRSRVISILPNIWMLDGHYIYEKDRRKAIMDEEAFVESIIGGKGGQFGVATPLWNVLKNKERNIFVHELLQIILQSPNRLRTIDKYRLEQIRTLYNHDVNIHNTHFRNDVQKKLKNRLPVVRIENLISLDKKKQLELAIVLCTFVEYRIPSVIVIEALSILFVDSFPSEFFQEMLSLPPFGLSIIIFKLKSKIQEDLDSDNGHYLYEDIEKKIWETIPLLLPTWSEVGSEASLSEPCTAITRRYQQAVILLSRSPSFPSILADHLSGAMQETHSKLLPLLKAANMTDSDIFHDLYDSSKLAWIGGHDNNREEKIYGSPSRLPWNKGRVEREYARPWADDSKPAVLHKAESSPDILSKAFDPLIVREGDDTIVHGVVKPRIGHWVEVEKRKYVPILYVHDDGSMSQIKEFRGIENPPFFSCCVILNSDLYRVSDKIWRHRQSRCFKCSLNPSKALAGRLHRVSEKFHRHGIPRSFGVINENLSTKEVNETLKDIKPAKHQSQGDGPKTIELFSNDSTWDSNYVLAPKKLIEMQNYVHRKKNTESREVKGWRSIRQVPTVIDMSNAENQHGRIKDSVPLAPIKSNIHDIIVDKKKKLMPSASEPCLRDSSAFQSTDRKSQKEHEWAELQREMGSLLGYSSSNIDGRKIAALPSRAFQSQPTSQCAPEKDVQVFLTSVQDMEGETYSEQEELRLHGGLDKPGNDIDTRHQTLELASSQNMNETDSYEDLERKVRTKLIQNRSIPARKVGYRTWSAVPSKSVLRVASKDQSLAQMQFPSSNISRAFTAPQSTMTSSMRSRSPGAQGVSVRRPLQHVISLPNL